MLKRIAYKLRRLLIRGCQRIQTSWLLRDFRKVGQRCNISFPIQTHVLENVSIGDNFRCGERLKLRTFNQWGEQKFTPEITIGNNVSIESDCHISAINQVAIGDNVLMASFVYISDHSHGEITSDELSISPLERPLYSKGPIKIGNNVWIGEKVCVLPNVRIGEGAITGAGSIVTRDVPARSVVAGNPAQIIKQL